jgi:hypothetical protein
VAVSYRKSYSIAVGWLKSSRPRHIRAGRFALRCFAGNFAAGLVLLGLIGLFFPATLGLPGSRAFGSKWSLVLAGIVAAGILVLLGHSRHLHWLATRIREPFIRSLRSEHFDRAADALAACPDAFHSRWATSWVWGPVLLAGAGTMFAFACAYFLVDGVLSGGRIGPGNPIAAAINALLSLICFALAAARLATWRVALSVHSEVTGRYSHS